MEGQQPGTDGVERVDLEKGKILFAEYPKKVRDQHMRQHLSVIHLDGDLPGNDSGNQDFISRVGNHGVPDLAEFLGRASHQSAVWASSRNFTLLVPPAPD